MKSVNKSTILERIGPARPSEKTTKVKIPARRQ
jgi:hypothetical protein